MKQGVAVGEVVKEEKDEVCKRYPHMRGVYEGITKNEYAKMLRNRISALKSRVKKKSEERELKMLRIMARRIFMLKKYELMPVKEFELLKIENDDEFEAIVNFMSTKNTHDPIQDKERKQDIVPSLDHFMPEKKRPVAKKRRTAKL